MIESRSVYNIRSDVSICLGFNRNSNKKEMNSWHNQGKMHEAEFSVK